MRHQMLKSAWLPFCVVTTLLPILTAAAQPSQADLSGSDEINAQQNADFYLDQTEKKLEPLEAFATAANSAADKALIPYFELMSTERDVKQIARKLKLAREAIKTTKPATRKRNVLNRRYNQLATRVIDADAILMPLRYHLRSILNPQSFPELKNDALRLREIATMFADPYIFDSSPALASEIFAQLKPAGLEFERVIENYDRLIAQKTTVGRQLSGLDRFFKSKRDSFLAASELAKTTTPLRLKLEIGNVIRLLTSVESDQATAELIQSLPARIADIDDRIKLLSVLSPENSSWSDDYDALNLQLKQYTAGLAARHLPSTGLPNDNYREQDRDQVIALVRSALSSKVPNSEQVSIQIVDSKWQQQTIWKLISQPARSIPKHDRIDPVWRRDKRQRLNVCLILSDPANKNLVFVKRYRIEKLRLPDGSESVQAIRDSLSIDDHIRYSHATMN